MKPPTDLEELLRRLPQPTSPRDLVGDAMRKARRPARFIIGWEQVLTALTVILFVSASMIFKNRFLTLELAQENFPSFREIKGEILATREKISSLRFDWESEIESDEPDFFAPTEFQNEIYDIRKRLEALQDQLEEETEDVNRSSIMKERNIT